MALSAEAPADERHADDAPPTIWPEERLSNAVRDGGGSIGLTGDQLLAHFGSRHWSLGAQRNITTWLRGVGVGVEPPLLHANRDDTFSLYLEGGGAPPPAPPAAHDPPVESAPAEPADVAPAQELESAPGEPAEAAPQHDAAPTSAERAELDEPAAAPVPADVHPEREERRLEVAPDASYVLPAPARTRAHVAFRQARRFAFHVCAVLGVLLVVDAAMTLLWREPITALEAAGAQADASQQAHQLARTGIALRQQDVQRLAAIRNAVTRRDERMSLLARSLNSQVADGKALGFIAIKRIGINFAFVQGTQDPSLREGPAHYRETVLPGAHGTVGIAGHRTTYLAPFRHVDDLRRGDPIVLTMPYGRFTYRVEGTRIVLAGDTDAFRGVGYDRLVLSACHPLYSASHRILIFARLVRTEPLGQAAAGSPQQAPAATPTERTAAHLKALGRRTLSTGMQGNDVRTLQWLLGVPVTGRFDEATRLALTSFQESQGLPPDGVLGPATRAIIARRPGPPSLPVTPPDPGPAPPPKPSTPTTPH